MRTWLDMDNTTDWEEPVHSVTQCIVTVGHDTNVYIVEVRETHGVPHERRWRWVLLFARTPGAMPSLLCGGSAPTMEQALADGRASLLTCREDR